MLVTLWVSGCAVSSQDPSVDFIVPYTEGAKAQRLDDTQAGHSLTSGATSTYRLHEVKAGGSVARKVSGSSSFKVKGGLVLVQ